MIKNPFIKGVILIGIIILFAFVVYGFIMGIISSNQCKEICNEQDSIGYDIILSGNYKIDDLCVCYFDDNSIKSFRLGT